MSLRESITVGLEGRNYPIHIGPGVLDLLPDFLTDIRFPTALTVITNHTVNNLYGDTLLSILEDVGNTVSIVAIEDGEQFKSFATLSYIYDELVNFNVDRSSGIVALGGGVVGDIAGFAAATVTRGVPSVQVPTTLLSQVDSSVGGKTAINHPMGKNLIGAFNQPQLVCIDTDMLSTLPRREYGAGIAEILKYGIIRDSGFYRWLKSHRTDLVGRDPATLVHAIKTSCQIKAGIVEIDEKESSVRAVLNFGHTFGHAVEALTNYQEYLHGEAVSIGMVVAARMSQILGYCTEGDVKDLRETLAGFNLPVACPRFKVEEYLSAMMHDKKVKGGRLNMVFNKGIGDCLIETVDNPADLLKQALAAEDDA